MSEKKKPGEIREEPLTYEHYAALPDDGLRYELVDGVLELMSPSPAIRHQVLTGEMLSLLRESCNQEYLIIPSPIDVILSQREVRQPDLIMIHRSRLSIITKRGVEGPPDLVVEILSPSSVKRDKVGKRKSYAHFSVPEYWIVDPSYGTLEQYVLKSERYELAELYEKDDPIRSEIIPCVSFTMHDIMSRIPDFPNA